MSSTVTTVTITTVTTAGLLSTLSVITVITLFLLLVKREIISTSDNPRVESIVKSLNTAIVPLTIIFVALLATRIVEAF